MNRQNILKVICILIPFIYVLVYYLHPIQIENSDLGRHLLLGKIITSSMKVPLTNLLTYTTPSQPFVNTHWLSEVIFYTVQRFTGFNGLIVFSFLLVVIALTIMFVSAYRKHSIFTVAFVALMYLQIMAERTDVRPELFSYIFLSSFIYILYTYKERYTKLIFLLPLLELVWVNTHIYFFIGIAIFSLFLGDILINSKGNLTSKKNTILFSVFILTCLTTFINPNFIRGAFFPLLMYNNYGFTVEENASFFMAIKYYNDPTLYFFGLSVILLWVGNILSWKKVNAINLLFSLFFTCIGLFAVRVFPLFAIGTFIPMLSVMENAENIIRTKWKLKKSQTNNAKVLLCIVLTVATIPTLLLHIENYGWGVGVRDNANDAVQFLISKGIKGPIYNNYNIGNYLEYTLYPKEKAFVDARPEAFPKEFFENVYLPMQSSITVFEKYSNRYKFNALFIDHTNLVSGEDKLIYDLSRSEKWKMIYLNNTIVIFIANSSFNSATITSYSMDQNTFKLRKSDIDDKAKVRNMANFFRAVEWEKLQLRMYIRYLDFEPQNCEVLRNVLSLLQKEDNSTKTVYLNKLQLYCL